MTIVLFIAGICLWYLIGTALVIAVCRITDSSLAYEVEAFVFVTFWPLVLIFCVGAIVGHLILKLSRKK